MIGPRHPRCAASASTGRKIITSEDRADAARAVAQEPDADDLHDRQEVLRPRTVAPAHEARRRPPRPRRPPTPRPAHSTDTVIDGIHSVRTATRYTPGGVVARRRSRRRPGDAIFVSRREPPPAPKGRTGSSSGSRTTSRRPDRSARSARRACSPTNGFGECGLDVGVVVLVEHGRDDDRQPGPPPARRLSTRLPAAHAREPQVHERDVDVERDSSARAASAHSAPRRPRTPPGAGASRGSARSSGSSSTTSTRAVVRARAGRVVVSSSVMRPACPTRAAMRTGRRRRRRARSVDATSVTPAAAQRASTRGRAAPLLVDPPARRAGRDGDGGELRRAGRQASSSRPIFGSSDSGCASRRDARRTARVAVTSVSTAPANRQRTRTRGARRRRAGSTDRRGRGLVVGEQHAVRCRRGGRAPRAPRAASTRPSASRIFASTPVRTRSPSTGGSPRDREEVGHVRHGDADVVDHRAEIVSSPAARATARFSAGVLTASSENAECTWWSPRSGRPAAVPVVMRRTGRARRPGAGRTSSTGRNTSSRYRTFAISAKSTRSWARRGRAPRRA